MFQFAKVLHVEFPGWLYLDRCNISSIIAGDEQIVNPNHDVNASFGLNVKAEVGGWPDKADFDPKSMDLLVQNVEFVLGMDHPR